MIPKSWIIITGFLAAGLLIGMIFLATWDIPAPTQQVERVLPDDRFPK